MRERVLSYIRKHGLMRAGDRVGVAVSGGADSVALLRLLLGWRGELGIVVSVVHFNHKIRAEADADEEFVRGLAVSFDLEFHAESGDVPEYAREHKLSLEAAGRKLRYGFFERLATDSTVHRVSTAHTRDDQAETVLMRLLRGAGTKGLAGISPGISRDEGSAGGARIVRPLLQVAREELREYLRAIEQSWREDASNLDVSFTRNRLRHQVMPVLRELNPKAEEVLCDAADIARAEEEYWQAQVRRLLSRGAAGIRLEALREQPLAMQRRLVRAVAEEQGLRLEFRHVEEVLAMADRSAHVELPHGWEAVRAGGELRFRRRCQNEREQRDYECELAVPGRVQVCGRIICAEVVEAHASTRVPHGSETRATQALLDLKLAKGQLWVRNWRAGDRYWPAHTKEPKKLKELLQAPHIPREHKPYWPVVLRDEEIVWVPGFAAPEKFRVRDGAGEALLLKELPLGKRAETGT